MTRDSSDSKKDKGEAEIMAAVESMPEPDRTISKRLHAIISSSVPSLIPRTWYGMPAYSIKTKDSGDKIVCFFRSRAKFSERYMTIGFNDVAKLDEANMWPIYFALTKLTTVEEKQIKALVQKAVS